MANGANGIKDISDILIFGGLHLDGCMEACFTLLNNFLIQIYAYAARTTANTTNIVHLIGGGLACRDFFPGQHIILMYLREEVDG